MPLEAWCWTGHAVVLASLNALQLPMFTNEARSSIVAQCMLLTLHNTTCNSVYQFPHSGAVQLQEVMCMVTVADHGCVCIVKSVIIIHTIHQKQLYCWSRWYSQSELPIHLLQNSTMLSCWITGLCKKGPSSEQNNECKQKLPNYSIVLFQPCMYIHMLEWVSELQTPAKVEKS